MKKASATVIYKPETGQIYNLTLNHGGNLINLIHYDVNHGPQPYKYPYFSEVYRTVLSFTKQNGFYLGRYKNFGLTWYDIQWIDISNPTFVKKHGYDVEKGVTM